MSQSISAASQNARDRLLRCVVLVLVCASLTATVFFFFVDQARQNPAGFASFTGPASWDRWEEIRREWRPRIGAIGLAALLHDESEAVAARRIAGWCAAWFLAVCVVYAWIDARRFLLLALGTVAAVVYTAVPLGSKIWYPWDMPALFFSALALGFALRRNRGGLVLALVVGALFKETVLVFALLFLFFEGGTRARRIFWAAGAYLAGYVPRLIVEAAVGGTIAAQTLSFRVGGRPDTMARWQDNLLTLTWLRWDHVLLANVGTLLLIFLLPARDRVLRGFKWAAAAFLAGVFFAGSVNEVRIFLELVPGGLLILAAFWSEANPPMQDADAPEEGP